MWRVSHDVCFLPVFGTEFGTLQEEDQDGSGDAGRPGHESGLEDQLYCGGRRPPPPRSALGLGERGASHSDPGVSTVAPAAGPGPRGSSVRVLRVAFCPAGQEGCEPQGSWLHISATL